MKTAEPQEGPATVVFEIPLSKLLQIKNSSWNNISLPWSKIQILHMQKQQQKTATVLAIPPITNIINIH